MKGTRVQGIYIYTSFTQNSNRAKQEWYSFRRFWVPNTDFRQTETVIVLNKNGIHSDDFWVKEPRHPETKMVEKWYFEVCLDTSVVACVFREVTYPGAIMLTLEGRKHSSPRKKPSLGQCSGFWLGVLCCSMGVAQQLPLLLLLLLLFLLLFLFLF